MHHIRKVVFPKQNGNIFKGFGPAFLAIALGIGSGEFILWPFLSAHYGFGILWGAILGITLQVIIIIALERQTAFLGHNAIENFSRIFRYSFLWILLSTLIAFGWPGFASMTAKLLQLGFHIPIPFVYLSILILFIAGFVLLVGKNAYKNILLVQKINLSILLALVIFLFLYYFRLEEMQKMFFGFFGIGEGYSFIPVGISLITFLGAIAYAGSGGNLLLVNSFYVEKEKRGLVGMNEKKDEEVVPNESDISKKHIKEFEKESIKQNLFFFWSGGLLIIILLAYIAYVTLYGETGISKDFSFVIQEASVFSRDIHPIVGKLFIFSGAFALFGVQLGILDFLGRIASLATKDKQKKKSYYRLAIIAMILSDS